MASRKAGNGDAPTGGRTGSATEQLIARLRKSNRQLKTELTRERKAAESARLQLARWSGLLASLSEGISIIDATGRVVLINSAARELLGIPLSVHRPIAQFRKELDFRFPDGRPVLFDERPFSRALRGETFSDYELVIVLANGTRRNLAFSGSAVRDEAGRIVLTIIVYHDITLLRELEQMKQDYISIVSHDLRAPLTIILGRADLLHHQIRARGSPEAVESADAILRNARRMDAMIQDLVDTARLEAGQVVRQQTPTDLLELVQAAVDAAVTAADRSRIEVQLAGPLPPVSVDRGRVERVVANLLINALKYSAPGSAITIEMTTRDRDEVVTVTDRGPGIPAADLPHLFEKYFRAAIGRTTLGLGLGLYTARLIVEASGGQIWVTSEVGKGSTFAFSLPMA